jgi:malto-oligosyltrehalose trehalohydrolase
MNDTAFNTYDAHHSGRSAVRPSRGFAHDMPFGAQLEQNGSTRFRLWAPACHSVAVELEGAPTPLDMASLDGGWHELRTSKAGASSRYRYLLPDGTSVPDPASRFQPDDVHGASAVVDPRAYAWRALGWKGRPWHEAVIYELHIGAFTAEGTFRAAIGCLDHLVTLGVTAVEIMPIGDFPGQRNWGYDGVFLYAPDSAYGTPDDLKALIDAAHARGIMVFLDVVYNHFGPDGNYLSRYAPDFFNKRHQTPWGAAVNYDGPSSATVREFVIHNALFWLNEYRFDGLRLDAVHAIADDGPKHLLQELSERVLEATPERYVHLLLENEANQARWLDPTKGARYTAQWNDDVHHALHCAATRERHAYYGDYMDDDAKLGRALAEGFAFQGEIMQCTGKARGEPSAHLPPAAFIAFIQNHDQVGNRAFGERLGVLAGPRALRAVAAVYLLLPQVPMVFMGEEWNAKQPFPYFCNFSGELGTLVTEGRRREFASFPGFDSDKRAWIPDPELPSTFISAKLDWAALERPAHAEWLSWYRLILQVRHREIVPRMHALAGAGTFEILGRNAISVRWRCGRESLVLQANLSHEPVIGSRQIGRVIWHEGKDTGSASLAPWAVHWAIV